MINSTHRVCDQSWYKLAFAGELFVGSVTQDSSTGRSVSHSVTVGGWGCYSVKAADAVMVLSVWLWCALH